MNLELEGKIVLITASGQGLGKSTAESFLQEKAKVILTDINRKRIDSAEEELAGKYGSANIFTYCGDLTKIEDIRTCVNLSLEKFGVIDILIANMGSGRGSIEWKILEDEWERIFEINFNGARRIVDEVLPVMIKNKSGSILFVSSIAGIEYIGAPIHYSVAKAALIAYSKNLSRKISHLGIRVNSICPGNIFFENGTWDMKLKEDKNTVLEKIKKEVPQNRFANPDEISNLILFISSNRLSFMTGSCVIMDGGQTISF